MSGVTVVLGGFKDKKKKSHMDGANSDLGDDNTDSEENDSSDSDSDGAEVSEEEVARAKEFKALTGLDGSPEDIAIALKNFGAACGWGGY